MYSYSSVVLWAKLWRFPLSPPLPPSPPSLPPLFPHMLFLFLSLVAAACKAWRFHIYPGHCEKNDRPCWRRNLRWQAPRPDLNLDFTTSAPCWKKRSFFSQLGPMTLFGQDSNRGCGGRSLQEDLYSQAVVFFAMTGPYKRSRLCHVETITYICCSLFLLLVAAARKA